jgi:hypothetical protein
MTLAAAATVGQYNLRSAFAKRKSDRNRNDINA